jgi:hypothetical protein
LANDNNGDNYGLIGCVPSAIGFVSATGGNGWLRFVVLMEVVAEPVDSVPLFDFGSTAGSTSFTGSVAFGASAGVPVLF